MGIKARELFGVDPDMLEGTTYAGTRPPYSCLTDGYWKLIRRNALKYWVEWDRNKKFSLFLFP